MAKIKISVTQLAREKFEEIINGSKNKILDFFSNIDKYIEDNDYDFLFEGKDIKYYYKKCENIYLIFSIIDEDNISIIDFLTKTEFNKIKPEKD